MGNVEDVAKIIINYENAEENPNITNLTLNKLLYFAQGHCLAETGEPMFDDDFEAWDFGPVIPKIYHKYKNYGKQNITSCNYLNEEDVLSEDQLNILECVLEKYSDFDTSKLVDLTHKRETPWAIATNNGKEIKKHLTLSKEKIKKYFKNQKLETDDLESLLEQIEVTEAFPATDRDEEESKSWNAVYKNFLQVR
jgi:uncharacterized phage-associated protein